MSWMNWARAWSHELVDMPEPGYAWYWGETSLQHKTMYGLMDHGLIDIDPRDQDLDPDCSRRWRTNPEEYDALAAYVASVQGISPDDVGVSVGCELSEVEADWTSDGIRRQDAVMTDVGGSVQLTFDGDRAEHRYQPEGGQSILAAVLEYYGTHDHPPGRDAAAANKEVLRQVNQMFREEDDEPVIRVLQRAVEAYEQGEPDVGEEASGPGEQLQLSDLANA